ncbi:MAG: Bax inhibitor-1/YccA family protein [Candidatus Levybacteria bacterium]|nr:Bax inhibitor-1/YccA family protein [Candidatus Levybacteria bacterium]
MDATSLETRTFMSKVYGWMSAGLVVTAGVAMYASSNAKLMEVVFGNPILFFGLIILQLGLVVVLSAAIKKISANTALLLFLLYAALTGLTFSAIFLVYTAASIGSTFLITAGTFGAMSMYGYVTKTDLTTVGNIAFMGLIGIILASLVNIFWPNGTLYWIITYIGILVFVALTAYDTQKIKRMNIIGNAGTDEDKKESIIGALTLYLDFINLFLLLLRIFGRRR